MAKRPRDTADDTCPVCLDAPSAGRALPCGGAHVLCRQAKVGIALQRQSLFWLSPEVQMQSAWSSRAELIEMADRAVWLPGWLSFVPAPGSAAVGARSAAAGIVLVGPRTITHAAITRTIRASNQQFASWYSAGTEMPLG